MTTTSSSNPAETYEGYMVPALFGPFVIHLIARADLHPGDRVLDVACGTGIAARRAAPRVAPGGTVTGVDRNPGMLAVARRMARAEGVEITWDEGRAEALPFGDAAFDRVLCQFGLMIFDDQTAALAEMRRVAAPGAMVAIAVWQGLDVHPFYRALDEAIERHLGQSSVRDIFALGDERDLRALLSGAGFRDIAIEPVSEVARFPSPDDFLAGEIDVDTAAIPAMQHLDAKARHDITDRIRDDMAEALLGATEGDFVVLPFHALIATARC